MAEATEATDRKPKPHISRLKLPSGNDGYGRWLVTRAAYDAEVEHQDISRTYGRGSLCMFFTSVHPAGTAAAEWELLSAEPLPETEDILKRKYGPHYSLGPTKGPVWIHCRWPTYDGAPGPAEECDFIGGPCYTDIGFSLGDMAYRAWAYGGLDGIYGWLREMVDSVVYPDGSLRGPA